ncbi:phosphinothricin acetyltransferase [Planoprotostelium fungivorum]|uniref:Phosphinothricin acetyltransferase n=1 Tax=Planoprotostelium fungivorum TaxID=1890364 RepID=A0A2P6NA40_9EUKA|nr:phosphinothricin acetyltransferase [Planoprotostelium fungivorum]
METWYVTWVTKTLPNMSKVWITVAYTKKIAYIGTFLCYERPDEKMEYITIPPPPAGAIQPLAVISSEILAALLSSLKSRTKNSIFLGSRTGATKPTEGRIAQPMAALLIPSLILTVSSRADNLTQHIQNDLVPSQISTDASVENDERVDSGGIVDLPWPSKVYWSYQLSAAFLDAMRKKSQRYATAYRPRRGYRFSCESSVYLDHKKKGLGVGKKLMVELLQRLERGKRRQVFAGTITDNPASIALHRSLVFVQVSHTKAVGWKLNQWIDTITFQRALGEGAETPPQDF